MRIGGLVRGILVGVIAYAIYAVINLREELDIPSYAISTISRMIIRSPFPSKDFSDLPMWRTLMTVFAAPNNFFHRVSSINGEDVDINTYLEGKYEPVTVRVYTEKGVQPSSVSKPVIMWFHGGGFVLGGIVPDDAMCTEMAHLTDAVVVSVDYRMAPEHPFPTPINDCISALQWASQHIAAFGGDPKRIFVAGESAGGNIAAVLTAHNLDTQYTAVEDRVSIVGTVLIYPATDIGGVYGSYDLYGDFNGILTKGQARWFAELYCGHEDVAGKCGGNYLFSPLKAPSAVLEQFPPTLVMLAKHDVLLDEGLAMEKKLHKLGVKTELLVYPSTVHFFFGKHIFAHGYSALVTFADRVRAIAAAAKA